MESALLLLITSTGLKGPVPLQVLKKLVSPITPSLIGSSISFRLTFNHERPHEALGNETPGSIYAPSARMLPSSLASFQYPKSFLTRRVNNSGDISWHKGRVFVSEVFRNEDIGLEQMDEDLHRVFFHNTELASSTAQT
jgi:hypothetical protein